MAAGPHRAASARPRAAAGRGPSAGGPRGAAGAGRPGGSGARSPRVHRWEDVRYPFVTRGNPRPGRWVPAARGARSRRAPAARRAARLLWLSRISFGASLSSRSSQSVSALTTVFTYFSLSWTLLLVPTRLCLGLVLDSPAVRPPRSRRAAPPQSLGVSGRGRTREASAVRLAGGVAATWLCPPSAFWFTRQLV